MSGKNGKKQGRGKKPAKKAAAAKSAETDSKVPWSDTQREVVTGHAKDGTLPKDAVYRKGKYETNSVRTQFLRDYRDKFQKHWPSHMHDESAFRKCVERAVKDLQDDEWFHGGDDDDDDDDDDEDSDPQTEQVRKDARSGRITKDLIQGTGIYSDKVPWNDAFGIYHAEHKNVWARTHSDLSHFKDRVVAAVKDLPDTEWGSTANAEADLSDSEDSQFESMTELEKMTKERDALKKTLEAARQAGQRRTKTEARKAKAIAIQDLVQDMSEFAMSRMESSPLLKDGNWLMTHLEDLIELADDEATKALAKSEEAGGLLEATLRGKADAIKTQEAAEVVDLTKDE